MTVKDLILDNLQDQRRSGLFCDIRLYVGKRYIWAHSAVLCPLSTLLAEYYSSPKHNKIGLPKKNTIQSSVKIKLSGKVDIDCFECLEKLIDFIYDRKTSIKEEHAPHIASYCQILNLSTNLLRIINNTIDGIEIEKFLGESDLTIKSEPPDSSEDNYKLSELCEINFKQNEETCIGMDFEDSDKEEIDSSLTKSQIKDESYLKLPTGKTQNCIGCNFKCYKSVDLLTHLRQTGHGGNVCSLCWTELDNASDLKEHFSLHEHPKPFFCTYCDLRFQTRSLLGQHLPRHLFEKPFVCPHCQKAFKRKHGLNCHMVTHSNEKKHLCDECGFSTTHARILRAHKLGHSGDLFKCSFPGCAHTSTRKENMKQHLATHSNEKPFVCELCGHKFTQSKSLKRHSLIHSKGDVDNMCPHCPFKARRIDNLKAHILRQHTEKYPRIEVRRYSESIMVEPDVRNIIEPPNGIENPDRKRRRRRY